MDKLAEWGIAAHHSGKGVWDSDPDLLGPYSECGFVSVATNGAARRVWSGNLNDAEIARRVSEKCHLVVCASFFAIVLLQIFLWMPFALIEFCCAFCCSFF